MSLVNQQNSRTFTFDEVRVRFDQDNPTDADDYDSGEVRVQGFQLEIAVDPEDQPLQFGIAAIDADGDVSAVQTLDVLLQGGEETNFTVTSNIDTSSLLPRAVERFSSGPPTPTPASVPPSM